MFSEVGTLPIPYILIIVHSKMFMYVHISLYIWLHLNLPELFFWPQLCPLLESSTKETASWTWCSNSAARSRTSSVTPAAPALQRSARPRQRHGSTWWHTAADDRVDQKDDNHDIPTMITWNNHDNMELQYVFSFQLSFWKRWITFSVTVGKETFPGDFQSPFAKGQTSMCTAAPPPKASQENYNNIQQSNKYMKKCPTLWRISILY